MDVGGPYKPAIVAFDTTYSLVDIILDLANPFDNPTDVAVHSSNLYVADTGEDTIFVFEDEGSGWDFKERWDISSATDSNPPNPSGIAVDSSGQIYVVDNGNNVIKIYDETGTQINTWGSTGTGNGEFNHPWDVFIDKNDFVYIVDQGNHRIQKFEHEGTHTTSFGENGNGPGEFGTPTFIHETGNGTVYVTDTGNNRIHIWDCTHKLCAPMNALLDVENDTKPPWEWNTTGKITHQERIWNDTTNILNKLNNILRRGCTVEDCHDCIIIGEDCVIPFSFRTNYSATLAQTQIGGSLIVDDINFSYWIVDTIAEVPYGSRFRLSEGGNWTVGYICNGTAYGGGLYASFLVPEDCKIRCDPITYLHGIPPSGRDEHDAIDDAMYRLLDQELDTTPKDNFIEKLDIDDDGVPETCFDPEHMWFDAKDEIGIQSLWGPETAKLIVWMT